jgi:two-component system CheB/CheR fusion protein
MTSEDKENREANSPQMPDEPVVVAIGASAGGLRPLQTFFSTLPSDTGATFVVVVHLDPERRSELASLLSTRTKMPVIQVTDRQKLRANHVYVIPPDRRLEMADHEVKAVAFEEPHGLRSPIDQFFRSVADRLGDGFAVIFSGAGTDGAVGVRAVKESGGIILVQDPEKAEYGLMPRAAIQTEAADFVLPVAQLAAQLCELIQAKRDGTVAIADDGRRAAADPGASAGAHRPRFHALQALDHSSPHCAANAGGAQGGVRRILHLSAGKRQRGAAAAG